MVPQPAMEFVVHGITAFMIVRDEEQMLPGCLDSLIGVVDALVVLDTGSCDRTLAVAETARNRFRSVIIQSRIFDGFGPSRQAALELIETPWALWVDADERLSGPLQRELQAMTDDHRVAAYSIPFRSHVLGRTMTCRELAGQRHLRLFRTASARFVGAVHESVQLGAGKVVAELKGPMEHHSMQSWRAYWKKVDQYTQLESASGSRGYAAAHLLIALPAELWRQGIWRGCWRDGWPGFVWAWTSGLGSVLRDWRRLTR